MIAMVSNGYSRAQIERACHKLNLPFSQESLQDTLDLIEEKMNAFKCGSVTCIDGKPLMKKSYLTFSLPVLHLFEAACTRRRVAGENDPFRSEYWVLLANLLRNAE